MPGSTGEGGCPHTHTHSHSAQTVTVCHRAEHEQHRSTQDPSTDGGRPNKEDELEDEDERPREKEHSMTAHSTQRATAQPPRRPAPQLAGAHMRIRPQSMA
jgi:hypothetical protein